MVGFFVAVGFELLLLGFIIWGAFNEKKLIRWERQMLRKFKKRIQLRRRKKVRMWLTEFDKQKIALDFLQANELVVIPRERVNH